MGVFSLAVLRELVLNLISLCAQTLVSTVFSI
jgi:hypothetical protein